MFNFSPASDQEKWKHTQARFVEFMKRSKPLLVPTDERGDWRTDTGVTSGDEISMYYDPMIAKFISYSNHERFECIRSLVNLIDLSKIEGVKTNSEFLKRCLFHPDFAYYKPDDIFQISTNVIAENLNMLCQIGLENQNKFIAIATAALTFDLYKKTTNGNLFSESSNWRLNYKQELSWYFVKDDKIAKFTIEKGSPHSVRIRCDDGEIITIDNKQKDSYLLQMGQMGKIIVNGPPKPIDDFQLWNAKISQGIVQISDGYYDIPIKRINPESTSETSAGGNAITAPMPGKIIAVNIAVGDSVKAGDKLIIMEAMKMEMALEAPRDCIVAAVNCTADALVSDGEVLLELEPEK
ncbi:MAG: biotin/lipoyl-binding protein [Robiginitomaculum sp.]|nr:biotin/lipoyl-binding protein [Robiginitomaculum sp.]